MDPRKSGTIAPFVIAGLLIAVLGGTWGIPQWIRHRRIESEYAGTRALHQLATAEAEFRANDRDRNGVLDFWTADVAGLYKYGLIPREVAEADAAPLVPLVPYPIPYKGNFFRALRLDDSETPPVPYGEDTDGKSGKVHSRDRFGFVVYPAGGILSTRHTWVINENNTAFRNHGATPPPANWPSDSMLRSYWSKID